MPTKDSESLKFIKYGDQVAQGLADGVKFAEDAEPAIIGVDLAKEASLTGTINIETEEAREALRKLTATAEAAMRVFKRVWEVVKEIVESCPSRRVVYLAAHGSPRVRKKNVKRLVRYYRRLNR